MNELFFTTSDKELEEIIRKLSSGEVLQKGNLPFSLHPTYLERIRKKVDDKLKVFFEAAYRAGVDFVEPETQNQYYGNMLNKNAQKADKIDEMQREELSNPDIREREGYIAFYGKQRVKLQREKCRLNFELNRPHDVSSLALPKMVYMQIIKNTAKKWEKVEQITDDTLLAFVEKLDNSQFNKLLKYVQKRLDDKDKDIYDPNNPNDPMNSSVMDNSDIFNDDFIVEVSPDNRRLR